MASPTSTAKMGATMKPCSSCPFKKEAVRGLWHPAHYLAIAYLGSADVPGGSMGCHKFNGVVNDKLTPEKSPPCGGWIRAARDAVNVRIRVATGGIDPNEPFDGEEVLSVVEMARVNGLDVDRLPPLTWNPESGVRHVDWVRSIIDLKARLTADPELARDYIVPGSPLDIGVSPAQVAEALGAEAARAYFGDTEDDDGEDAEDHEYDDESFPTQSGGDNVL